MWIIPQWNGIDNQADLIVTIQQDGYFWDGTQIFLGPGEEHPDSITNGTFTITNTNNYYLGTPNKNKDGIYIYLSPDSSGTFNRWYVDIVDGYSDDYVTDLLTINIQTPGVFYDVKKSSNSVSSNGVLRSGRHEITYKVTNPVSVDEGITFTADYEHYLFDFGNPHINTYTVRDIPLISVASPPYLTTEDGEALTTERGEILLY